MAPPPLVAMIHRARQRQRRKLNDYANMPKDAIWLDTALSRQMHPSTECAKFSFLLLSQNEATAWGRK
jgi:hypothetical protein